MSLKTKTVAVIIGVSLALGGLGVDGIISSCQKRQKEENRLVQSFGQKNERQKNDGIEKFNVLLEKTRMNNEFSLWKREQAGLIRRLGALLDEHASQRKAFDSTYDARPVTLENAERLDSIMAGLDKTEQNARSVLNHLEADFRARYGEKHALSEELGQARRYLKKGERAPERMVSRYLAKLQALTDPYQEAVTGLPSPPSE
ncbi:MAG: hypothetical protein M1530_01205 [Candidatus Marsarchaeota archaeon]|nr:hypothetical protein [Candidatus Marsarchaeota archaeon]